MVPAPYARENSGLPCPTVGILAIGPAARTAATHTSAHRHSGRTILMATVRDILAAKGAHVQSIGPEATALDAALLMNEHKIGSLVVLDGGRLIGIITERDVLQRIVAQRRDPAAVAVRDVMTAELVCCR